jgi:putative transposase
MPGLPRGGWQDQCWTLTRIAELVRWRFTVSYTLAGLDLLLHRFGWSVQVSARQAAERDEAAIAAWQIFEHESGPTSSGRWPTSPRPASPSSPS